VLTNLLNNSSKYSHAGCSIRLMVTDEIDDKEDGKHVLIRISDNGIGISPDRLEDIFQLFTQVNAVHERESTGLGIGLSLVKNFVELHGGQVFAESEGIGSSRYSLWRTSEHSVWF
jgi:signal transduction histidine kinase